MNVVQTALLALQWLRGIDPEGIASTWPRWELLGMARRALQDVRSNPERRAAFEQHCKELQQWEEA